MSENRGEVLFALFINHTNGKDSGGFNSLMWLISIIVLLLQVHCPRPPAHRLRLNYRPYTMSASITFHDNNRRKFPLNLPHLRRFCGQYFYSAQSISGSQRLSGGRNRYIVFIIIKWDGSSMPGLLYYYSVCSYTVKPPISNHKYIHILHKEVLHSNRICADGPKGASISTTVVYQSSMCRVL